MYGHFPSLHKHGDYWRANKVSTVEGINKTLASWQAQMFFSARFQHHSSQYPRAGVFFLACTVCRSRVFFWRAIEAEFSIVCEISLRHDTLLELIINLLNGSTLEFIMRSWARDPFLAPQGSLRPWFLTAFGLATASIFNKQQIYANHVRIIAHLHSTSLYIRTSWRMGNGIRDRHVCATYDAGNTFGVAVLGKSRACLGVEKDVRVNPAPYLDYNTPLLRPPKK